MKLQNQFLPSIFFKNIMVYSSYYMMQWNGIGENRGFAENYKDSKLTWSDPCKRCYLCIIKHYSSTQKHCLRDKFKENLSLCDYRLHKIYTFNLDLSAILSSLLLRFWGKTLTSIKISISSHTKNKKFTSQKSWKTKNKISIRKHFKVLLFTKAFKIKYFTRRKTNLHNSN